MLHQHATSFYTLYTRQVRQQRRVNDAKLPWHELTCNVLQENDGNISLAAELNKMGALESTRRVQYRLVRQDTDGVALNASKAAL